MDCNDALMGCKGGMPWVALESIKHHGLEREVDYPYFAQKSTCREKKQLINGTISEVHIIKKHSAEEMQKAMLLHGPHTISVHADEWPYYSNGLMTAKACGGTKGDHAVLAVGWGMTATNQSYWIVKNSWGGTWGMQGYIWVELGVDACGIEKEPLAADA